ncbi:MAG: ABC transporter substrate-binding protein [Thermoguttaceae bacterium]|nr:ABC transporter substrate-binding protein [Thermoguttaceae bacterium]MDW8077780.1 MqnA/MqnD/SBP family protein [Thermoguttaceae bacterium]
MTTRSRSWNNPNDLDLQTKMELTLAHSPDADDAFMFYALATGKVNPGTYHFSHFLADIETLNRAAAEGRYDVTALSVFGYAFVADKYVLLESGGSIGDGYGPIVVGRDQLLCEDLRIRPIAVPGTRTTAFLALSLWLGSAPNYIEVPFDRILEAVRQGQWAGQPVDAGLIIHEGQLSYEDEGLLALVDLGNWWKKQTGLPLPLGVNAIRRSLGPRVHADVAELLRQSVLYAREHPEEALSYAAQFGRGLSRERLRRFVDMYVNDSTVRIPPEARKAIELLLSEAAKARLIEQLVQPEFAQGS